MIGDKRDNAAQLYQIPGTTQAPEPETGETSLRSTVVFGLRRRFSRAKNR